MGKISCLNVYKHRVCGEPPANKHRRERARAEHTHTHPHPHTRTLTPTNGPSSPPRFNPDPNPLSPGEGGKNPPKTPSSGHTVRNTKTLAAPLPPSFPSLPSSRRRHTHQGEMRDKRERSLHNKRQLELERFGARGVGRKGGKENSPFPRDEPGGKGETLHASPRCFPPPSSLVFFLSFFSLFPHYSRWVLFPPRDGRKPRAISSCQRSPAPASLRKEKHPKNFAMCPCPPFLPSHLQPGPHRPLAPRFPHTRGGIGGLIPSPPRCFLLLSPPLLGALISFAWHDAALRFHHPRHVFGGATPPIPKRGPGGGYLFPSTGMEGSVGKWDHKRE